MIAKDIATYDIPAAKKTDRIDAVIGWMEEYKVSHIPVEDKGLLLGVVQEDDLLDANDVTAQVSTMLDKVDKEAFVEDTRHAFEVLSFVAEKALTLLPVVDSHRKYAGAISLPNLVAKLAEIGAFEGIGSIIILELNINDYSLSEIARIVESNDAKIISSYVTSHTDSTKLEVTIKINNTEVSGIIKTFERFEYDVVASYNTSDYYEDLKDRYDQFMRYLDT